MKRILLAISLIAILNASSIKADATTDAVKEYVNLASNLKLNKDFLGEENKKFSQLIDADQKNQSLQNIKALSQEIHRMEARRAQLESEFPSVKMQE